MPAGLTQYKKTIAYQNPDGTSLEVVVFLDFNVQTGFLSGTFTSLDPMSGQAPQGVFDGFLYPEAQSVANSDGFVQYTVQPKSSLANATAINQQASVVFDTNAPLATNTATNTIDTAPPTSSVTALPARTSLMSIPIAWFGTDNAGGAGVQCYNIFVSIDGGAYTEWQADATATSENYTATLGHTYAFFSQAIDNLGNIQTLPTGANTSVVTTAAPWQNPVNRLDVLGQGNTIVPADALAIINYLNLNPAGLKLPASFPAGSDYLDVLGTGIVVPDDALQVIDYLNLHPAVVNEAVVAPQVPRAGGGGIVGTATGAAAPVFFDSRVIRAKPRHQTTIARAEYRPAGNARLIAAGAINSPVSLNAPSSPSAAAD